MTRPISKLTALEPAKHRNADLLIGSFPVWHRNPPSGSSALQFLACRWHRRATPTRRLPVLKWELHRYCCEINDASQAVLLKTRVMTWSACRS